MMRKKVSLILLGLLLLSFSVSARDLSPRRGPLLSYKIGVTQENRIQKIEDFLQLDKKYFDYLDSYAANCYFDLDIIFWNASNTGWPYYLKPTNVPTDRTKAINKRPSSEYDAGFRMGWGIKTPLDWDIYLQATHFSPSIKDSKSDPAGLNGAFSPAPFGKVNYKWKLEYDLFDLEIGRPFHVGKTISMRPFICLRGGWMDQKGTLKFSDPLIPILDANVPAAVYYKEDLWMIGPRTGLDLDFYIAHGIGFYGNLAGALLYGETKSYLRNTYTNNITNQQVIDVDLDSTEYSDLKANLQVAIGLAWGGFIHKDFVAMRLRAGWEANYWWNQNHEFVNIPPGGNGFYYNQPVIIQGIVLSSAVYF